jgi:NAD(P)H-nitrite reductase large subunit
VINSLDDLVALRRLREQILKARGQACWAVIGGGLIGCEVSSDLAKAGDRVVLYHALPRLMERQLVEEDSASLLKVLADHGIEVKFDSSVQGFEKANGGYAVKLADGSAGVFDGIIVACGFKPRTELAAASGLPVNRGILVDGHLCTADPHIFALGDAAECSDSRIYAYVMPIRHQAAWLANHLAGTATGRWEPPDFKPRAKVHGFVAAHPYLT